MGVLMRYTILQLSEYQYELNRKFNKDKVEAAIDSILKDVKQLIKEYPTQHYYHTQCWDNGNISNTQESFFCHFSGKELEYMRRYFKKMGFKVEFRREDKYSHMELQLWLSW